MARIQLGSFLSGDEILFVGYSRRNAAFSAEVMKAFVKAGKKVYPVNPKGGPAGVEVYPSLEAVPARPALAYVVTSSANSARAIDALAARGVRRILFQSRRSADAALLERCAKLGIETAVACPLMAFGGGFHRFHGFLSGVRA